ncbi:4Fe-4S dicluster domain-containing protein [Propionispira arboris]|uniref:4Fe-4S dicluster domain-containing protein n=1 Tax=Propionispira arboris TaxID=84035 RepID=A0A1H6TY57_9FIRM|nr:4Fe-4S dicluster domain-containing protein [Propionispira arboris]SEI84959.1 4Fe-4S dicluster domain-containing protein [Propionispira arboris]
MISQNEIIESTCYIGQSNDNNPKPLPKIYSKRENCCGCTACYAICPVKAIVMKPDKEGFLYPVVDASQCIRCYRCIDVCVFKQDQKKKGYL